MLLPPALSGSWLPVGSYRFCLESAPSSGCLGTAHTSHHQGKLALKSFLFLESVRLEMWASIWRRHSTGFPSVATLVDS